MLKNRTNKKFKNRSNIEKQRQNFQEEKIIFLFINISALSMRFLHCTILQLNTNHGRLISHGIKIKTNIVEI